MAGAENRGAEEIVAAVAATGLLLAGPVLVSCSAGRDSACLLDVVVRLVGPDAVSVLHVDHGLRGAGDAADDAAAVRAWCEAAGVALFVRRADATAATTGAHSDVNGEARADRGVAADPGDGADRGDGAGRGVGADPGDGARGGRGASGNVHAWARDERRRLAREVAATIGAHQVLVAHTRTDLVETAIGRLATQPGRRALLSMRVVEDALVRPLLAAGVSREETAAYCRERGLVYRDDPSNADRSFARARVRHDVLPVLRSLNPRAEEAVARTLGELAEESAVLDALVAAELDGGGDPGVGGGSGPGVGGGPGPSIPLKRLAALPPALARLVLRELCERTLGAPCPRAAARLDEVLALTAAAARKGSGSVDVGGGARIELRGGIVRCARSAGPAAA